MDTQNLAALENILASAVEAYEDLTLLARQYNDTDALRAVVEPFVEALVALNALKADASGVLNMNMGMAESAGYSDYPRVRLAALEEDAPF